VIRSAAVTVTSVHSSFITQPSVSQSLSHCSQQLVLMCISNWSNCTCQCWLYRTLSHSIKSSLSMAVWVWSAQHVANENLGRRLRLTADDFVLASLPRPRSVSADQHVDESVSRLWIISITGLD